MNDKLIEQIKTAHNNPKTPTGRYRNSDLISLVEEIETLRAAVSSLTHAAPDLAEECIPECHWYTSGEHIKECPLHSPPNGFRNSMIYPLTFILIVVYYIQVRDKQGETK